MGQAAHAATRRIPMKRRTINRDKPAPRDTPVEELTPKPDLPAAHHPQRVVLTIAGKRYEMTLHTEVREITRGPAKVIEMPGRSSIKH
jgi:hypothetical protein